MTTVKFSSTNILKEIQSKLYLAARVEFTQQEILELAVSMISENIDLVLSKVQPGIKIMNKEELEAILRLSTDWVNNTEDSSKPIDQILYQ